MNGNYHKIYANVTNLLKLQGPFLLRLYHINYLKLYKVFALKLGSIKLPDFSVIL